MELLYCHIPAGNFGDDLNRFLWPELFGTRGVGTLLGRRPDSQKARIVLGTGARRNADRLASPLWDVRWVRGPLTARQLGLPPGSALGDAALLWSGLAEPKGPCITRPIGIIPHWKTSLGFDWCGVAQEAGLRFINASRSPAEVAHQISQCRGVLTESLHGAIFSDALAIPGSRPQAPPGWWPVGACRALASFR